MKTNGAGDIVKLSCQPQRPPSRASYACLLLSSSKKLQDVHHRPPRNSLFRYWLPCNDRCVGSAGR